MVGAATEKPLEPKQVRTRGTHSKLVSDERIVSTVCAYVCLAVERLKVVMEDIECQISTIRDQQKLESVLRLS